LYGGVIALYADQHGRMLEKFSVKDRFVLCKSNGSIGGHTTPQATLRQYLTVHADAGEAFDELLYRRHLGHWR